MEMRDTLNQAWPELPGDQLGYFISGLYNQETSSKLRIEGPRTLTIDIAQIYEDLLNNNTSMITKAEYLTPPGYSLLKTPASPPPISSGQPKIIKFKNRKTPKTS